MKNNNDSSETQPPLTDYNIANRDFQREEKDVDDASKSEHMPGKNYIVLKKVKVTAHCDLLKGLF